MQRLGRIVLIAAVTIFCVTVFMMPRNQAKADPHAMFFTAIGQQQIFFNMLAALDQADYVESATNEGGLPPGYSRQELLEKREEAGFPAWNDPTLEATETALSSVLTRSITLEGHDMWSSYVSFQFALEVDRRRNSVELINLLCERGLGIRNCEEGAEDPRVAFAREEHAYNKRPLNQMMAQQMAGEYALRFMLFPGYDQAERRNVTDPDYIGANVDRPFNFSAAQLGASNRHDPIKNSIVHRMGNNALNINNAVDPTILDRFEMKQNGVFGFTAEATTSSAVRDLSTLMATQNQLLGIRIAAEEQKRVLDQTIYADGARADTYPVKNNSGRVITNVNETLIAPSYAKRSQLENALSATTNLTTDPAHAGSIENVPGTTQLVPTSSGPEVGGIRDRRSSQGHVASAIDDDNFEDSDYDDPNIVEGGVERTGQPEVPKNPRDAIPRHVSPIGSMEETGVSNFFTQLQGGSGRFGINFEQFLNGYGRMIINDLNS